MTPACALTGADLVFDAARHEYRLPDGRLVPNVTSILRATGVSTDFEEIASRSARMSSLLEYRRALGVAVHADCHAFDDNELNLSAVHADVRPYIDAWTEFRANTGLLPFVRERRVFHPGDFYCGTLDGLFLRPDILNRTATPNDGVILIDIKIGDPHDAAAHLQTAAYATAYMTEHPECPVLERWAVQLLPDRQVPYDITPYRDWRDINYFRAVLATFAQQPERRARRAS